METFEGDRLHSLTKTKLKHTIHTGRRKEHTHTEGERDKDNTHTSGRERQEEKQDLLEDKDPDANIWNATPTARREREFPRWLMG